MALYLLKDRIKLRTIVDASRILQDVDTRYAGGL